MLARFLAFLRNQADQAEALEPPASLPTPDWIKRAAIDDKEATVALDAATRSVELAQGAVSGLQDKAASHLTFTLALVPFALAATGLSLRPGEPTTVPLLIAFLGFLLADVALVVSAAFAALASGLVLAGGISLDRLGELADKLSPGKRGPAALKAAQAEALRYAAQVSYASGVRVAQDLYEARRMTVIAVLLATASMALLVGATGVEALWQQLSGPRET